MNEIEALLDLLPRLEDPERSFAPIIHEPGTTDPSGDLDSPWVEWPGILRELTSAIQASGLMQDFDWMSWDGEAGRHYQDPSLLSTAELDSVGKLLTLHINIERAVPGHLAGVCSSGHLQAVLRRLRELVPKDA